MAIFQKKDGGFMDVIRCDESNYLIWKWRPKGTTADNSQRANAIRYGSSLRVKDGSVAVFVYSQGDGVYQDFIEGPYDDLIETKNFPVLASVVGAFYQGGSPFQAEVYFINLANLIQIKFGVPYFDVFDPRFLEFGVPTAVRGTISFRIADYREFIKLHRLDSFEMSDFYGQVKDAIVRYVKSVVSNAPNENGIPVVQLERKISEISDLIEADLSENLRKDFAISVSRVDISDIELDKNSRGYKKLESATQSKTAEFVQKAVGVFDSVGLHRLGAKKIKNTVKDEPVAEEEKSESPEKKKSGGITSVFGGKKGKVAPPPIPVTGFYVVVDGKQKGPFDLPKLDKMLTEGHFSAQSLVWKEGLDNWIRASEAEELAPLFGSPIPPAPITENE